MVNCPDCKREMTKPDKTWRYGVFEAEFYSCRCGARFREYTRDGKHSFTLKYVKGKGYRKV